MPVTDVKKDADALTLTVTSEFEAPLARVWELWENPRLLERWWGPPTYPATFVDHDLTPGATCTYFMTGPDGDKARGWWRVVSVDKPNRLELADGFADDSGAPNPDLPTMTMTVELSEQGAGITRMTIQTRFDSAADMEKIVTMGMAEGMSEALGQIDEILREEVAS